MGGGCDAECAHAHKKKNSFWSRSGLVVCVVDGRVVVPYVYYKHTHTLGGREGERERERVYYSSHVSAHNL